MATRGRFNVYSTIDLSLSRGRVTHLRCSILSRCVPRPEASRAKNSDILRDRLFREIPFALTFCSSIEEVIFGWSFESMMQRESFENNILRNFYDRWKLTVPS